MSSWLPTLASSALNFLVIVGLMLFTMYYMFMQETYFLLGLHRYLPFRNETLEELGESLKNNVNANVLGQVLVALVQGVLTGLTLWIFGVPDSLFWGVVAFFMAFLPVLGTPLVWGPAALYQFSQGAQRAGHRHFAGGLHRDYQRGQPAAHHAGQAHGRHSPAGDAGGPGAGRGDFRHYRAGGGAAAGVVFPGADGGVPARKPGAIRPAPPSGRQQSRALYRPLRLHAGLCHADAE